MKNPWSEFTENVNTENLILRQEQDVISEFNQIVEDKYKIHTNIMPAPFMGDVKKSPVMILALNPGYDIEEEKRGFYSKYSDYWSKEIQHKFDKKTPLFCLDDEYYQYSNYWADVLKPIISELGDKGKEIVAKKVSKVQLFPYQSTKYKAIQKSILKKNGFDKYLPSQLYSFQLVKNAIDRDALIVIPRAVKKWEEAVPELKGYKNKCTTNNYLNITLSQKNLGSDFNKLIEKLKQ